MRAEDICNITSESGLIATLFHKPDFVFYSENLLPNHFSDKQNACMYLGVQKLAQEGVKTVDAFGLVNILESSENTRRYAAELQIQDLQDFFDMSASLSRNTVEEYQILVSNVLDMAQRRDVFRQLKQCEALCFNETEAEFESKIYGMLDGVFVEYSSNNDVPQYATVVDEHWEKIKERQRAGFAGIPFKFPALNEYVTIERGELVIFGAEQKQGKSMLLLNCAVDLLKQDYAVLYLDSELNTRMFTARLLAHLSGIDYKRLVSGGYTQEEGERIAMAREWIKTRKFTHLYIPAFDQKSIYTYIKKVKHTQDIDVLIVDYFKGKSDGDAFNSYQELGRFVDMIKNQICGDMNIAGIGAAQATREGRLADSSKIARNASTICMISDKTPAEIQQDGQDCGNKKLNVTVNRNGMQMASHEYIDLHFDGNRILYCQAHKQHIPQTPY